MNVFCIWEDHEFWRLGWKECCGVNVCAPPQWEVVRSRGGLPWAGCLTRGPQELVGTFATPEAPSHQTLNLLVPWPWTSQASRTVSSKFVVYRSPSVSNFVIAAPAGEDRKRHWQWNVECLLSPSLWFDGRGLKFWWSGVSVFYLSGLLLFVT